MMDWYFDLFILLNKYKILYTKIWQIDKTWQNMKNIHNKAMW